MAPVEPSSFAGRVLPANPAAPRSAPPETGGGECVAQSVSAFRLSKDLGSCWLFGVVVAVRFRLGVAVRVGVRVWALVEAFVGELDASSCFTGLVVGVLVGVLVGVAVGVRVRRFAAVSERLGVSLTWRVETPLGDRGVRDTSSEA
jgi:hypothetical protein